jgi:hypothetical protein
MLRLQFHQRKNIHEKQNIKINIARNFGAGRYPQAVDNLMM